jgi:hypothetical protein
MSTLCFGKKLVPPNFAILFGTCFSLTATTHKKAHLKIMEGRAHDALGHGRLELAAKLAHFHLEIAQHIVLLLPCSFSDESKADPET